MKQVKSLAVRCIRLRDGLLISKDFSEKNMTRRFKNVNVRANNLLIDSTTQYDKSRFLFAKEAELSCTDYETRTPDNMYTFKIDSMFVQATKHKLILKDISLSPRYTKEQFRKMVSSKKDYFDMTFPEVIMHNVDWWKLTNAEKFFASESDVYNAKIKDYMDGSLPEGTDSSANFPAQLLMQIPCKINIDKFNLHNLGVVYEEYNPDTKKSSGIYIDKINGTIKNLTNVPGLIKNRKNVTFSGSGLFMHQVPFKCSFDFDMAKYKTGNFSAGIQMTAFDNSLINPVTETLSLFSIKRGSLDKAGVKIKGDIFKGEGNMLILYHDLHVTPLKIDRGDLKKKPITSFFANTFFIKNNNPSKNGTPRNVNLLIERTNESFFGFIWTIIRTGILKTIGVPLK